MTLFGLGQSPSKKAVDVILDRYRKWQPDSELTRIERHHGVTVVLIDRWVLTVDDARGGVQAQVRRPHLPGNDDPPILARIYDYQSIANTLAQYAMGKLDVYDLRVDGVYDVVKGCKDHYGNEFQAGTRLTFAQRHFLPYEGGHTVVFREATVYIQEDDELYAQFADHFALAPTEAQIVPARNDWPVDGGGE